MKVYAYPADFLGCGNYRVRWPAQAARSLGVDVEIVDPGSDDPRMIGAAHVGPRVTRIRYPEDADVIVIQRPNSVLVPQMVAALVEHGVAVVVDIDDDMAALSPRHVTWASIQAGNPRQREFMDARAQAAACSAATWVTASTPALLEKYGRPGRRSLLRNRLPAGWAPPPRMDDHDDLVLGWGGEVQSHPDDLAVVGNAVARLRRPFRIVGREAPGAHRLLGIRPDEISFAGEVPFDEWAATLQQMDVAVAPLQDSAFNRAKSWLKPLEYAAAGVPFVASDLPEYVELVGNGHAQIAHGNNPKGWHARLRRMLDDKGWRDEARWRGLALAAEHVLDDFAHEWADAWSAAEQARSATMSPSVR